MSSNAAATPQRASRIRPPGSDLELFRWVRGVRRIEVSVKTGIPTTRLSMLDRGLVAPREGEVEKILAAIEEIVAERER